MSKKLFEYLAVEKDVDATARQSIKAAKALFGNDENFLGIVTKYAKLLEDRPELPNEERDLPNRVEEVLDDVFAAFGRYINVTLSKEMGNTAAFADVVIDGETFLSHLPATALLNLESRLDELYNLCSAIPTLPRGERWEYDDAEECYVSATREQLRTIKIQKPLVLYEATEKHPAQTQLITVDEPAYRVERQVFSGAITPSEKARRLERIDTLRRAAKQARQRANTVEVKTLDVSRVIFDFING